MNQIVNFNIENNYKILKNRNLKNCPFCRRKKVWLVQPNPPELRFAIVCEDCGAFVTFRGVENEPAEITRRWNEDFQKEN